MSWSNGISLSGDANQALYQIVLKEETMHDIVSKYGTMQKLTSDQINTLKTTYVSLLPKSTEKTIGDLFIDKGIMTGDKAKHFCEFISVYDTKDAIYKLKNKLASQQTVTDEELANWLSAAKSNDVYKINSYFHAEQVIDEVAKVDKNIEEQVKEYAKTHTEEETKTYKESLLAQKNNTIRDNLLAGVTGDVISVVKGEAKSGLDKSITIADSQDGMTLNSRYGVELYDINLGYNDKPVTISNLSMFRSGDSNFIGSNISITATNSIIIEGGNTAKNNELDVPESGKITSLAINAPSITFRNCNFLADEIAITGTSSIVFDGSYIKSPILNVTGTTNIVINNSQLIQE